jgi:hypothetical protein
LTIKDQKKKGLLMTWELLLLQLSKSSGEIANTAYIMKDLAQSRRCALSSQDWFLYFDKAPVHTAASV